MKHPGETTLALFAGKDLGPLARWRTQRHLDQCAQCRAEVTEFSGLRQEVGDLAELPGLNWNRLGAEMKANIHLGLAAGECVRHSRAYAASSWLGMRAAVACASVALLLLASMWLERPAPVSIAQQPAGVSLQAIGNGLEMRDGDQAFVLKNRSAGDDNDVTYSAGAQGSIGARFMDRTTGYMTINTVYVQ